MLFLMGLMTTGCLWITEDEYQDRLSWGEDECDLVWYVDADGDGYGDPNNIITACALPEGHSSSSDDCDDSDPLVNPEAEEDCATGADDDCNGQTDEEDAINCIDWYQDGDGDGYGATDPTCSCALGPDAVAQGTDCDDNDPDINPGQAEICSDSFDNDCDGTSNDCALLGEVDLSSPDAAWIGEDSLNYAGLGLAASLDLTGDGVNDIVVGAPRNDRQGQDAGVVYVVPAIVGNEAQLESASVVIEGVGDWGRFGNAIHSADVNGDVRSDLIVGSPYPENDTDKMGYGQVDFFTTDLVGTMSADDADASIEGAELGIGLVSRLVVDSMSTETR